MLALLVCKDRECRAAFEVEGTAEAIHSLRCEDCDGELHAAGWADAEPERGVNPGTQVRRQAA